MTSYTTIRSKAFSLIELMVAMGILSVLMLMLTIMLDQVQKSWTYSESRISQFREARVAFDLITKNLGQASLNTYFDLRDEDGDGLMDQYYRTSEMQFLVAEASTIDNSSEQQMIGHAVFFQAPLGFSTEYRNLNNLFNGRGYFVGFGSDETFRPSFVRSDLRYRYRLFEFRPPAELNEMFADGGEERDAGEPQEFTNWFRQSMNLAPNDSFDDHLNPLADNIVTLVVSPRDSLISGSNRNDTSSSIAPNYIYDSNDDQEGFESFRQQVPPLVRLTMVAIDEESALRLAADNGDSMPEVVPPGLFGSTARYNEDIAELTDYLNEKRINHKIFSSMVMLRNSKWSDN